MIETVTPAIACKQEAVNLFYYRNTTSQIQVIRVDRVVSQWVEKVVFPGEQMLFYSIPEAWFDVYNSTRTGLTLVRRIPCSQLQVLETEV